MRILKPTKQRNCTKKIYGFDIETYDNNKRFFCATIFSKDYIKTFYDKDSLIEEFKSPIFKNSFVAATNLGFDFFGTFFKKDDVNNFKFCFRGSNLIFSRTYTHEGFHRKRPNNNAKTLTFIDTLNYAHLSVKDMGKILKIPKLKKPKALGRLPKDETERQELITYNRRDAEISFSFINYLFDSFTQLGATPKMTIASTSMSLFKNKYLDNTYFGHDTDLLLDQFNAYYGGRTEAFKRGAIHKCNYYDFNSLYPSVMLNEYPDPNVPYVNYLNDISYIESYEGVADVEIYCPPDLKYPLLPYRHDKKLLFPTGSFRGWYSNIELRKALQLGYVIKRIYKNIFFKKKCRPFYDFVNDLYDKRLIYKSNDDKMEKVVKLLLNSLYGKFGQKFTDKDNWTPIPHDKKELYKYDDFEIIGDYMRIKNEMTTPASFCFPIWALYTTAYGRLKLYDILCTSDPVYCDTDSIITKKEYNDSGELGDLKREMVIDYGVVVKPKFYGFMSDDGDHVKIKGLGRSLCYDEFIRFIQDPKIMYKKFMKFKEAIRRGFIPNEIQDVMKEFSLEDDKRYWDQTFNFNQLQDSKPHNMTYISKNKNLYILPTNSLNYG